MVVAGVQFVPVGDVVVAFFPAKENLASASAGGEVHQAALGIFDEDLVRLEFAKDGLNFGQELDRLVDRVAADVGLGAHHVIDALADRGVLVTKLNH